MRFEQAFIEEFYLIKQALTPSIIEQNVEKTAALLSNAINFGRNILASPAVRNAGGTFRNALSEGWHGVQGNKNNWFGVKGITVAGTGLGAADALNEEDYSGQGRSRAERLATLGAGTIGGLAGGSLIKHQFGKGRLGGLANNILPMASSIAGQSLAEKTVSTPFKPFRSAQNQQKNLANTNQDLTLTNTNS